MWCWTWKFRNPIFTITKLLVFMILECFAGNGQNFRTLYYKIWHRLKILQNFLDFFSIIFRFFEFKIENRFSVGSLACSLRVWSARFSMRAAIWNIKSVLLGQSISVFSIQIKLCHGRGWFWAQVKKRKKAEWQNW